MITVEYNAPGDHVLSILVPQLNALLHAHSASDATLVL